MQLPRDSGNHCSTSLTHYPAVHASRTTMSACYSTSALNLLLPATVKKFFKMNHAHIRSVVHWLHENSGPGLKEKL